MSLAQLQPGAVVGGFEVGERLHAGAMSRLYRAHGGPADFPLLMKLPCLGAADSAELLLAFETEALILERLRGEHVPRFVAAGGIETVPYIVEERVEGRSLDRYAPFPLPPEEVARIGAAIADALEDIHAQDVVHHDLKPDNVLLRPDGKVVLLDFGLAHHRDLPDMLAEEQRYMAGSAPYISPEQVRGLRGDPRSDVFALGALLYEIATGKLTFGAPRTQAGMRDRLWREPEPCARHVAGFPPWLQEVILRCLEVDPARRYSAAAHVAFDLRHPESVPLTERSSRRRGPSPTAQALRWLRARGVASLEAPPPAPGARIVLVAVDTGHAEDARQEDIRRAVRGALAVSAEYRLICVSVIGAGPEVDAGSGDPQVQHRIRLRHWVEPLGVPAARLSLHVIEAGDPAATLVDFAANNHVDLIVIGAGPRHLHAPPALSRSLALSVTATAPCSVHVVRGRNRGER